MTVKLAIAVLAGGIAAQHSRVLISWDQCLPILVALGVLYFLRRTRIIVAFFAGFILLHLAASLIIENRLDTRFAGDSMLTVVRVIDFPEISGATTTMIVAPVDDSRLPPRSRVTWFEAPVRPALGDTWQLELRLRRPRGAANPGGFDAERWMFRERIHAAGYVVPGTRNRLLRSPDLGSVDRLRAAFVETSEMIPDARGVVAAVAVGARQAIAKEQWDQYAETGTSHLVAISGLHVGLAAVAAFVFFYLVSVILGNVGSHLRCATAGGVLLAYAYALVSGLGIPAQRATLMLALAAVAIVCSRRVRPFHVLATCALAVFVSNPVAAMMPGFTLSFGAVCILYRVAAEQRIGGTLVAYLGGIWTAQLFLFFGLLPLTDLFFDRVAVVAPLVNIVVVPVFSFTTVPASLLALIAVGFDSAGAELFLRLAAIGAGFVEKVVELAARFPVAGLTLTERRGIAALTPWLALFWVVLPRAWPGRSLGPLAVVVLLQPLSEGPARGCADIHVLDVGQGQSIVVRTARHTLVYDTGPAWRSGGSAAEYVVIPFLQHLGVQRIDWLVVSHGDLDHSGGVGDLSDALKVSRVFASEPIDDVALNEFACRAGQRWQADGVDFAVLHPGTDVPEGRNNGSCVLEVATGKKRALLTGDIEAAAEKQLVERGVIQNSLIVTVPHHGSQTSSDPAFVNRLSPRIAIASTGYRNRWNFPSERVRRRWEGAGARFYDTGVSGAISATMCGWRAPRLVRQERVERRRFWHDEAQSQ